MLKYIPGIRNNMYATQSPFYALYSMYLLVCLLHLSVSVYYSTLPSQYLIFFVVFSVSLGWASISSFSAWKMSVDPILLLIVYSIVIAIISSYVNTDWSVYIFNSLLATFLLLGSSFFGRHASFYHSINSLLFYLCIGFVLLLLYKASGYILSGRFFEGASQFRAMNQRDGVLYYFIFVIYTAVYYRYMSGFLGLVIYAFVMLSVFFLMFFSFSKGAYLLLLLAFIYFLKISYSVLSGRNKLILAASLVVVLFVMMVYVRSNIDFHALSISLRKMDLLLNLYSDYSDDGSTMTRILTWGWILEYLAERPLALLFGLGSGIHIVSPVIGGIEIKTSESFYFDALFRGGIVLLFLYVFLLMHFYHILGRLLLHDPINAIVYRSIRWGILGVVLFCFFEPTLRDREFGVFFFFLYGYFLSLHSKYCRSNYCISPDRAAA